MNLENYFGSPSLEECNEAVERLSDNYSYYGKPRRKNSKKIQEKRD